MIKKLFSIFLTINQRKLKNLTKNNFFYNFKSKNSDNFFDLKAYDFVFSENLKKNGIVYLFYDLMAKNNLFKYTKISEMNFSDLFWKHFFYYTISHYSKINFFNQDNQNYKVFNKFNILICIFDIKFKSKLYCIYIYNFVNDLLILFFSKLFIRKKTINSNFDLILHPNCNYSIENNKLSFRYIKNQNFTSSKNKYYVISLSRKNSDKVVNIFKFMYSYFLLRKQKNILFLESYISSSSFFKSYFKKINFDIKYKNYNLSFLKYDISKNLYLKYLISNFKKNNVFYDGQKIIYPFFEFIFGRIVSEVFLNTTCETVSFQHGSLGPFHKWRFYESLNILYQNNQNLFPKNLYLETIYTFDWFSNIKSIKTYKFQPNRNQLSIDKQYQEDSSILMFFLDMHDWEHILKNILTYFKSSKFNCVIRPHPSKKNYIKKYLNKYRFKNIIYDECPSLNLSISKYKPILFLVGQSGVINELVLNKLKVVIILNSNLINYSPLIEVKSIKKLYFNYNIEKNIQYLIENFKFKNYAEEIYYSSLSRLNAN